jgi:hypothetical protein
VTQSSLEAAAVKIVTLPEMNLGYSLIVELCVSRATAAGAERAITRDHSFSSGNSVSTLPEMNLG